MMGKETIVEVGVTLQRLAEFATATGFAMKLDEHRLEATAAEGVPAEEEDDGGGGGGWVVPPISVPTRPSLYRPYEHMYAPFFNDPRRYVKTTTLLTTTLLPSLQTHSPRLPALSGTPCSGARPSRARRSSTPSSPSTASSSCGTSSRPRPSSR